MKKNKIYALGFFDGVHLGHRALLTACRAMAQEQDAVPAAITFEKHPKSLFTPQVPLLINSISDRQLLLRSQGIELLQVLPVTRDSMAQPWREFLEILVENGATGFVCGDDFRFGHKGAGDGAALALFCQEKGLPWAIVPEQTLEGVRISSTHIRNLIEAGQMQEAAKFLGHPHILSGEVTAGRQLGRTIGIPTANIRIPAGVVVPKQGVYACKCTIDGKEYVAVTNVGNRPTVMGHEIRTESWILHFEGDLYGRELTLEFHHFLRPEQKFGSLEDLKAQIHKDAAEAAQLLR